MIFFTEAGALAMMRTHARCVRSVAGEYRRSLGAGRLLVGGTARLCARAQRKVCALPPIAPCMARSASILFLRASRNGSVTCPLLTVAFSLSAASRCLQEQGGGNRIRRLPCPPRSFFGRRPININTLTRGAERRRGPGADRYMAVTPVRIALRPGAARKFWILTPSNPENLRK